jgi:hypothetical protein
VERQRGDPIRVLGRQPHGRGTAQRHAEHVAPVDAQFGHEGGDVVGVLLGRVGALGLVALPRPPQVDRDAGVVLGELGELEGVAGVVGGEIGKEDQRLTRTRRLVVHGDVPHRRGRHGVSSRRREIRGGDGIYNP